MGIKPQTFVTSEWKTYVIECIQHAKIIP